MNAVVIKRKLCNSEALEVKNLLDNNYILYAYFNLPDILKPFESKSHEINIEKKREINYDTLNKVIAFGDKLIDNKRVKDLLAFDNTSVWYYHKFRTYFFIRNLSYEIAEIEYFSNNYEKVIYFSSNNYLKTFSKLPLNVSIKTQKQNFKPKINYKTIVNYSIFLFFRFIIEIFKYHCLKNKKHIIIDHSKRQSCINIKTFKIEKDNYNLSYLLDKMDKNFIVINEVEVPKFNINKTFKLQSEYFINKKKNRRRIFGEYIIIKALFSYDIEKQKKIFSNKLITAYNKIRSSNLTPVELVIIDYLKSIHKTSLYFIFKYLAYKKFFLKHSSFVSISSIDENSPSIKTIFDAAKFNGIKTIGIQHGNIHDLHPAYIYTKNDRLDNVMPDFTLVRGKMWKDFLIKKGNYNKNSLITVGQIRTDIIPYIKNTDKNIVLKKINIKSDKKIILYASQFQRDLAIREQAALDVFNAVKDMPDAFLIIKLHPSEKDEFRYYHSLAKKVNCKNYNIIYFIDLYLLLSISDIVITCFSTVGSEAVYFYKPLIILDHLKQDIQNYHRNGIAFQATNSKELKNYIEKILSNDLKINIKAYEKFINKYAYKIDGKVSERCINFIKNIK